MINLFKNLFKKQETIKLPAILKLKREPIPPKIHSATKYRYSAARRIQNVSKKRNLILISKEKRRRACQLISASFVKKETESTTETTNAG